MISAKARPALPVLILVGGQGTRIRSVIGSKPKALAPINGRPFLFYLLDILWHQGVRSVVLGTGYRANEIRKAVGNSYGQLDIAYSHESSPLGTGGAICNALPFIAQEQFVVMNGDSITEFSMFSFLDFCVRKSCSAAMVLSSAENVARYGRVEINSTGRITRFAEKGLDGPGLINSGVYFFNRRFWEKMTVKFCSLEREILPELMRKGMYGYPCTGQFIDIGIESSYRHAGDFFKALSTSSIFGKFTVKEL